MAYSRGDSKNIIVGAASLFIHAPGPITDPGAGEMPSFAGGESYRETLSTAGMEEWRNVGYTQNGMTLTITPDFGEVEVDQLLDSAKIFKQGMEVMLNTTFAEATLENLLYAIAASTNNLNGGLDAPDAKTTLPDSYSGVRLDSTNEYYHGGLRDGTGTSERKGIDAVDAAADPTGSLTGQGAQYPPGTVADGMDMLEITAGELGECPVERALCAIGPGTGACEVGDEIERIYVAFRALSMDAVTVSVSRDSASTFDANFRLLPANNGSYGRIIDRTFQTAGGPVRAPFQTVSTADKKD
jgi:hypothetical protein